VLQVSPSCRYLLFPPSQLCHLGLPLLVIRRISSRLSRLDPVQLRSQLGLLRLHQRSLLVDLPRGGIELSLCIVSLFSGFVHVLA
jgi:hypothetical protein